MVKSKRFTPIHDIATTSANQLKAGVADAERRLAENERQLEQLKTYRSDYVTRSGLGTDCVDAVRLQNFRSFLDRLSDAIRIQGDAVAAAKSDYENKRSQWSEKRVAAEALGKAVDRFKHEERRVADKREQDESDEQGMRKGFEMR